MLFRLIHSQVRSRDLVSPLSRLSSYSSFCAQSCGSLRRDVGVKGLTVPFRDPGSRSSGRDTRRTVPRGTTWSRPPTDAPVDRIRTTRLEQSKWNRERVYADDNYDLEGKTPLGSVRSISKTIYIRKVSSETRSTGKCR